MKRYFVTVMCCLANVLFYCTRLNLNIAILKMVGVDLRTDNSTDMQNYNASYFADEDPEDENHSHIPTFDWDTLTQQMILGSFYYGYAIMPIPGGWLAGRIGGKLLIVFSLVWTSILTAFIPWAAGTSVALLITLRILDGLGQGTAAPAMYVILSKWTVPDERTTMVSVAFNGMTIGAIVSSYLSSWICATEEVGGWPMSFYVYSVFGVALAIMWVTTISETPKQDTCTSKREIEYLQYSAISKEDKVSSVPWFAIFTSLAVWANVISYFALDFGYYVILTESPTFLSTFFDVDIQKTGFLISLPIIAQAIVSLVAAIIADYVIRHKHLGVLNTRKIFIILDLGVPSACFIAIYFVDYDVYATVILFTIAFGCYGFNCACILPNLMDITVKYSGIISGLMFTISSCAGFISPIVVGVLTTKQNDSKGWSILFVLTAGIQIFGMLFFLVFAKGEQQAWSVIDDTCSDDEEYENEPLNRHANVNVK